MVWVDAMGKPLGPHGAPPRASLRADFLEGKPTPALRKDAVHPGKMPSVWKDVVCQERCRLSRKDSVCPGKMLFVRKDAVRQERRHPSGKMLSTGGGGARAGTQSSKSLVMRAWRDRGLGRHSPSSQGCRRLGERRSVILPSTLPDRLGRCSGAPLLSHWAVHKHCNPISKGAHTHTETEREGEGGSERASEGVLKPLKEGRVGLSTVEPWFSTCGSRPLGEVGSDDPFTGVTDRTSCLPDMTTRTLTVLFWLGSPREVLKGHREPLVCLQGPSLQGRPESWGLRARAFAHTPETAAQARD